MLYEFVLDLNIINNFLFIKFKLGRSDNGLGGIKFFDLFIVVELLLKFEFWMIRVKLIVCLNINFVFLEMDMEVGII